MSVLVHQLSYISDNDKKDNTNEKLINLIVFFSVCILFSILVLGFLEMIYLNQFLQNKKKI